MEIAPFGKVKRTRYNRRDFLTKELKSLLHRNGIRHETSAPYSPHMNGTVELVLPLTF